MTTLFHLFFFLMHFVRRTILRVPHCCCTQAMRVIYPLDRTSSRFSSRTVSFCFCQVDKLVMEFVEEARKVPLPVTRATIQSFGVAAGDKMLAAASTSADKKLEMFGASEKSVRNFLLRHGMSSTVLHGEAGSVDVESIAEGMEAIRLACLDYDMETSSTSTRQASSSCFCRSARPCQQQRTGRRRGVRRR